MEKCGTLRQEIYKEAQTMNENDQEQERMKEEAYLAQVLAETVRQIAQAEDQLARREAA